MHQSPGKENPSPHECLKTAVFIFSFVRRACMQAVWGVVRCLLHTLNWRRFSIQNSSHAAKYVAPRLAKLFHAAPTPRCCRFCI